MQLWLLLSVRICQSLGRIEYMTLSLSVCQSDSHTASLSFSMQKRLNGSTSGLEWRPLAAKEALCDASVTYLLLWAVSSCFWHSRATYWQLVRHRTQLKTRQLDGSRRRCGFAPTHGLRRIKRTAADLQSNHPTMCLNVYIQCAV